MKTASARSPSTATHWRAYGAERDGSWVPLAADENGEKSLFFAITTPRPTCKAEIAAVFGAGVYLLEPVTARGQVSKSMRRVQFTLTDADVERLEWKRIADGATAVLSFVGAVAEVIETLRGASSSSPPPPPPPPPPETEAPPRVAPSPSAEVLATAKRFGVGVDVTAAELRARRVELAAKHHPDRHQGHARATAAMQEINLAYEVLKSWIKTREAGTPRTRGMSL